MNQTHLLSILILCFISSCKSGENISIERYKVRNGNECILQEALHPIKPVFADYDRILKEFYNSKFVCDVIYIEKISGNNDKNIFKRFVQDSSEKPMTCNEIGDCNNLLTDNSKKINQLLHAINKGHYIEICDGFSGASVSSIIMVKLNNVIIFSYYITRNDLEDFSETDRNKIAIGYELAKHMKQL